MNVGQYQYVEAWQDENDLLALPNPEDDQHEYKRSRTSDKELAEKISVAASAFWNTGGGIFVAGVDGAGKIDGGIASTVGRQSRRDWADQAVMKTQPPGPYLVRWIEKGTSINANCGVLVIAFGDGNTAHMAYDHRYRIRLGAHSEVANHYLVEAIRARKIIQAPALRGLLQRSIRKASVVELAILVINDAPALNVKISLNPLTEWLKAHEDSFPLQIPIIDRTHPFNMELFLWGGRIETFGEEPSTQLLVEYENTIGQEFKYEQVIDVRYGIDPMSIGYSDLENISTGIHTVSSQIESLHKTLRSWRKPKPPNNPTA